MTATITTTLHCSHNIAVARTKSERCTMEPTVQLQEPKKLDRTIIASAHNNQRGLLRLPAELRNQIYSHVFPTDQVIGLFTNDRHIFQVYYHKLHLEDDKTSWACKIKRHLVGICPPDFSRISTSLFQVCRQLRTESMTFYYGYNSFVLPLSFPDLPRTLGWLASRPEEFYRVLKRVYLSQEIRRCSRRSTSTHLRLLFVDLETFSLEVVPMAGVHDGCVRRYVEHMEKKETKAEFVALRTEFLRSAEVESDMMVRLVECLQHGGKSREKVEKEKQLWRELPFGAD